MNIGIDVSKWQGIINFPKIKDVDFVILRSSYRKSEDPRFKEYVEGFRSINVPIIGVYHFIYALNEQQAEEEARVCIEHVRHAGLGKDTIIFADFEYDSIKNGTTKGIPLGKKECNSFTKIFCEYVESQGYMAGIYTNIDYYKNWYDTQLLNTYLVWLADYTGGPDYNCYIQQYTSSGQVSGISGKVDMNRYYGRSTKVNTSRKEIVTLANSWLGRNESDGSHKYIVDIYNSYTGKYPRGTKMEYSWSWCACMWSALAIKLGYTDIIPLEISCGYLIENAKKMDCWVENDGYVAKPGDGILYDWDDKVGSTDNTGWPEHVGVIVETHQDSGYFVVVEGNYDNAVKKRTISINGRYIRGFIVPKYDDETVPDPLRIPGKDDTTIAREVIAGVWGNGDARIKNLKEEGYTYDPNIRALVNQILNGAANDTTKPVTTPKQSSIASAKKFDNDVAGEYNTTAGLYLRIDAGTNKKAIVLIPKGTKVRNYGFYSEANGVKWLLITLNINGVVYTGFSSGAYLKKK